MKILKPTEVKSIEQFFQLTQESLIKVMGKYLKTKYEKVYEAQEYLIAVGDIPVALVAHLDTVFPSPPDNIFYDRVKNVMWSPDGLGADDRAGVYAIVQLIKKGYRPTIIFTTDEEKGAVGAAKLIVDHKEPVTELKYIIQLDRHGSNDCVFYDCENRQFEEYVEKFGFVTAYGTFTDISKICPAWGIAGVNLSIGYVDEHSYQELLYVGNMLATIKKVENMLKDASNDMEPFAYIPASYLKYYNKLQYANSETPDEDDFGWDPAFGISKSTWKSWHTTAKCRCGGCHYDYDEYDLYPVKLPQGGFALYCADCIDTNIHIDWCRKCGEPFVKLNSEEEELMCYSCAEENK